MFRRLPERNRRGWLILSLAVSVMLIHLLLLDRYEMVEYGTHRYTWYKVSGGLLDCLFVFPVLCAWRLRRRSFAKALLLATVTVIAYDIYSFDGRGGIDSLLLVLLRRSLPILIWSVQYKLKKKTPGRKAGWTLGAIWAAALLSLYVWEEMAEDDALWPLMFGIYLFVVYFPEVAACIWASGRKYKDEKTRENWMLGIWLICDMDILSFITRSTFVYTCWDAAAIAAMPILYAWVFRFLMRQKRWEWLKLTLYYALCLLAVRNYYYRFFTMFGLILPILICAVESRDMGRKALPRGVMSAVYAAVLAALCFSEDRRAREIFYDLGGPAVNIELTERVNWLGYKLAAVKSFFAGNMEAFSSVSGLPHEEYPGYLDYIRGDSLGALTYRSGWLWLLVLTALVTAVAVLLIKNSREYPPAIRRDRQYMGIAYLIRALLSSMYIVTMTGEADWIFPFLAVNTIDLLVLGAVLWRYPADKTAPTATVKDSLSGSATPAVAFAERQVTEMTYNNDIVILSGNVRVKAVEKSSYFWPGRINDDRELVFKNAYEIASAHFGEGISNLRFRVHDREFTDLSFLKGETLQEFPDHYEIRRHADGTKFMFSYSSIPTFDLGDREWDSMSHMAVYADDKAINMIHCRHGYAIPRINVYIGLTKSIPAFTEWLEKLGCADRVGDASDIPQEK